MEPFCSKDTVTRLPTIQTRQYQEYLTQTLKSQFLPGRDVVSVGHRFRTIQDNMVVSF